MYVPGYGSRCDIFSGPQVQGLALFSHQDFPDSHNLKIPVNQTGSWGKMPKSVTCCIIPGQWNLWNRQMCETPTPYLPFNWRFGSCCHNHAWSYTSTKQQQQHHNRLKACPNLGKRYAGKFNAGFISVHHAEEAINITYLFTKKKKKYIEYLINRRNKIMINYSQEKRCYILDPGGVWIGGTILLQQLYSQSILQSQ